MYHFAKVKFEIVSVRLRLQVWYTFQNLWYLCVFFTEGTKQRHLCCITIPTTTKILHWTVWQTTKRLWNTETAWMKHVIIFISDWTPPRCPRSVNWNLGICVTGGENIVIISILIWTVCSCQGCGRRLFYMSRFQVNVKTISFKSLCKAYLFYISLSTVCL